jgi:hypothetical protein
MFTRFFKNTKISNRTVDLKTVQISKKMPDQLRVLIEANGGATFDNGLYRLHTFSSSYYWESVICNYIAQYKDRVLPFGFDWMGRQFALDLYETDRILMFDPATAEDFELNESLEMFHNQSLVDEKFDTLADDKFTEILTNLKLEGIGFEQCIGYKKPLFLGGKDSIDNNELVNLEVYWEIQSQIYHQIKNLPPGTKINKISFE